MCCLFFVCSVCPNLVFLRHGGFGYALGWTHKCFFIQSVGVSWGSFAVGFVVFRGGFYYVCLRLLVFGCFDMLRLGFGLIILVGLFRLKCWVCVILEVTVFIYSILNVGWCLFCCLWLCIRVINSWCVF